MALDIQLRGDAGTAELRCSAAQLRDLIRGLEHIHRAAARRLKELRGAHVWRATPHPDRGEWFVVQFNDRRAPFRPTTLRARRTRRKMGPLCPNIYLPSGYVDPPDPTVWRCTGCNVALPSGTIAYIEESPPWRRVFPPNVRLCRGCMQPIAVAGAIG